ncbi:MAG: hypothetical protein V1874_06350 [Spirochaetota bacterium]
MNNLSQKLKHCIILKIIFIFIISCQIVFFAGCNNSSQNSGNPNGGTNGPIIISVSTSRLSGVAPLSVFFDATGTTGLTDLGFFADNAAYMDATFAWNFDADNTDPDGKYENASGFVAAHVFEHPGTYRVHLDVYDAAGNTASKDTVITVSAFSGTTYYVAADGDDSGTGAIDDPFQTVSHALTGSHVQNNTRILFKQGDIFNTAYVGITSSATPVIVGTYDDPSDPSSDKPIIYSTESNGAYSTIDLTVNDWRVMNLEVQSGGYSYNVPPRYPSGINFTSSSTNCLKYRTAENNLGQLPLNIGGHYNTIAECEFYNVNLGGYSSGTATNYENAIIGNNVHDQIGDHEGHTFRLQGGNRFFIAHNTFGPNIETVVWDALTIRGNSEKVVIYKNTMYGNVLSIRPQNTNSAEEYQHHVLADSNLFIGVSGHRQSSVQIDAKDIVFRNNIFYNYEYIFSIQDDSIVGSSQRIKIYNNTFINPSVSNAFYLFYIDQPCTNLEFKNNLMLDVASVNTICFLGIENGNTLTNCISNHNMFYGSNWVASPVLFNGGTLAIWQSSTGNDQNSFIANPNLISTDPNNINFGKPQAGSPVIGAGEALLYNALDYNGNLRGASHDIGACEYY